MKALDNRYFGHNQSDGLQKSDGVVEPKTETNNGGHVCAMVVE